MYLWFSCNVFINFNYVGPMLTGKCCPGKSFDASQASLDAFSALKLQVQELLKEVKDLAEIVFHKSSAEVEEPAWTMFNPNGDCGPLMSFGCALFRDPKQSRRFFPKLPGGWTAWEFGLPILITRAARCHHCSTVSVDHSVLLRDLKSLIATSVAEGGQSTKNYSKWRGERTDKQPFSVMGTREVGGYDAPSVKGNANVQRTE